MKHFLERLIPEKAKTMILSYLNKDTRRSAHLRESTSFADIGEASPLVKKVFEPIKDVPGWFNVDDCGHFALILSYQSALTITGDLLEIGSYHGRSTAVMARFLGPGERIVVCDPFDLDTDDQYVDKPSPEKLLANIRRINPDLERDRIVIHECLSNDLQLGENEQFRFIHIDGGHSAEQVHFDLELCSKHLMPGGIIVVDDYHNKMWPGVTEGTDDFLDDYDGLEVLADLNRHGALGRKLYLHSSWS